MQPTRVFIHLGLHKTGTTSFQNYLADHRDALARAGILIPRTGVPPEFIGGQHQLAWSLIPSSPHRLPWMDREEAWRELRAEIDGSGCGRVILSSEDFSFLDRSAIAMIARHLEGCDIVPVLVLRRSADVVEGGYRTHLYAGSTETFAQFFATTRVRRDYAAMIADWRTASTAGEMIIASYDEPDVAADVVAALMRWIAPDVAVEPAGARERANPGRPAALLELGRLMRSHGLAERRVQAWLERMEKTVASTQALAVDRFTPPDVEADLDRAYRDDIARIIGDRASMDQLRTGIPLPGPRSSSTIDGPLAALLRLPDLLAASGQGRAVTAIPESRFPTATGPRPGRVSGHLDQPHAADGVIAIDRRHPIDFAGWLFEMEPARASTRILQFQSAQASFIVPLLNPVHRRDVAEAFPGIATEVSVPSGFTLCLDPGPLPPGSYRLRMGVADATGIAYARNGYAVDIL